MTDTARALPTRPIKVAAINFEPVYSNKNATVDRIERGLREAKQAGVDFAIFPEAALNSWFTCETCKSLNGPCPTHLAEGEYADGPLMSRLAKRVAELDLHALIGFFERDADKPVLYNAAALMGPQGPIGVARKVHLGRIGCSEGFMCRSGSEWRVWDTAIGPIGVAICFDVWLNPEVSRILALKGAWLIAVPTASVSTIRPQHLEMATFVRARENMVNVAAANLVGDPKDPVGTKYIGHSVIAGPKFPHMAEWFAKSDGNPGMAIATLDPAEFQRWRDELVPWRQWRKSELAEASRIIAREFAAFADECT
jgi:predicted amidohydrolase